MAVGLPGETLDMRPVLGNQDVILQRIEPTVLFKFRPPIVSFG